MSRCGHRTIRSLESGLMWHRHADPEGRDGSWSLEAARLLHDGAVLAYPTDTLYGLAADPRRVSAIGRLYRIKGRGVDQAIPLIAADLAQVLDCRAVIPPAGIRLAEACWPGPLTVVLAAWPGLCPDLLGGGTTVAVRVPDHPVARHLARVFGYPVTATSANRSGQPATRDPADVVAALGTDLDGIIDAGLCPGGPPSTIVDVTGDAPRLVRAGAVAWERVLEFLS